MANSLHEICIQVLLNMRLEDPSPVGMFKKVVCCMVTVVEPDRIYLIFKVFRRGRKVFMEPRPLFRSP